MTIVVAISLLANVFTGVGVLAWALRDGTARELAIRYIEECRQTHVDWIEWEEESPDELNQATTFGDAGGRTEHHGEWVAKYDHVLAVLRS